MNVPAGTARPRDQHPGASSKSRSRPGNWAPAAPTAADPLRRWAAACAPPARSRLLIPAGSPRHAGALRPALSHKSCVSMSPRPRSRPEEVAGKEGSAPALGSA
jgi:hypothetical protein